MNGTIDINEPQCVWCRSGPSRDLVGVLFWCKQTLKRKQQKVSTEVNIMVVKVPKLSFQKIGSKNEEI